MPDDGGEAANDKLNPDSRKDHPLAARGALEEKNGGGVGIEGGRQVNEEEAHLMHVAAEMLAGEAMSEFMDSSEQEQQDPEGPHIVSALIGERIKRSGIVLHPGPIPR